MIKKSALMNLTKPQALLRFNEVKKLKGSVVEMIEQDDRMWTVVAIWDDTGADVTLSDLSGFTRTETVPMADVALVDEKPGSLSAKFESNGKPGTIGFDSTGGFSYGSYQIATGVGTMVSFLQFLSIHFPLFGTALQTAGGDAAAREGKATFRNAWQTLAANPAFMTAQHEFIAATHYSPFAKALKSELFLDVDQRTPTMRDVVWSVAVQHGAANKVFARALSAVDLAQMDDGEIFRRVYAERSKMDVYFPLSTPQIQVAVTQRFVDELKEALLRLT